MPTISNEALHDMLKQLPDAQARSLAHIVNGKISHQVRCLGGCKGNVIAYLYIDGTDSRGRIKYHVEPAIAPDRSMKLRSSRVRLDGQIGFECWCGQDSRIAKHEAGILSPIWIPPTRDDLVKIATRLRDDKPYYPEINGVKEVDGFQFERVSA